MEKLAICTYRLRDCNMLLVPFVKKRAKNPEYQPKFRIFTNVSELYKFVIIL